MFAKSFVDHLVFRVFPGQNGVFGLVFEVREQNLFSWCRSHFQGFGMDTALVDDEVKEGVAHKKFQ